MYFIWVLQLNKGLSKGEEVECVYNNVYGSFMLIYALISSLGSCIICCIIYLCICCVDSLVFYCCVDCCMKCCVNYWKVIECLARLAYLWIHGKGCGLCWLDCVQWLCTMANITLAQVQLMLDRPLHMLLSYVMYVELRMYIMHVCCNICSIKYINCNVYNKLVVRISFSIWFWFWVIFDCQYSFSVHGIVNLLQWIRSLHSLKICKNQLKDL